MGVEINNSTRTLLETCRIDILKAFFYHVSNLYLTVVATKIYHLPARSDADLIHCQWLSHSLKTDAQFFFCIPVILASIWLFVERIIIYIYSRNSIQTPTLVKKKLSWPFVKWELECAIFHIQYALRAELLSSSCLILGWGGGGRMWGQNVFVRGFY